MKTLQKTIAGLVEGTENSIKLDVLTWLAGQEAETLKDAINTLKNINFEDGDVSHLIYYVDCGTWVYEHEKAVLEIINEYLTYKADGIDDLSWEQHNELSCYIKWQSGDDRVQTFNEEHYDEARELAEDEIEDWEELSESEQVDAIYEALDYLLSKEDLFELDKSDKVALAWLSFEYHAQKLVQELEGIKEVIEG